MNWCEMNQLEYVFGFARNERLRRIIDPQMQQAAALHRESGQAARVFTEFAYQTNTSWSRPRRVVAKAEQIEGQENLRYVVTSLEAANWPARKLYEELYCARGDRENRIKETVLVVRRASQRGHDASRPTTPVSFGCRLCADECLSPARAFGYGVGAGAMRDHPLASAPHRRSGAHHSAQGLDLHRQQLSALACFRPSPSAVALLNRKRCIVL